jgi:hypothetical protein
MSARKKANSAGKPPRKVSADSSRKSFGQSYALIGIALVAILATAVYGGVDLYQSRKQAAGPPMQTRVAANSDPGKQLRITLDPNLFVGDVKHAYQVAERDPALLAQMHCYCGCDKTNNHKNLLDCFRDDHGSHCPICTGEAVMAERLAGQGMPIEKVRDSIRDRYAHGE